VNKFDVDAIKAAHPLDAAIERMTGERIERHKIRCPFHDDSTPSLQVYEDGGWKCFGCGLFGDLFSFIGYFRYGLQYDPSVHFIEIVDSLGALEITPLPERITKPKPPKPRLNIDLDAIVRWHESMSPARRAYWHSRNLTDQTIGEFMLGFDGQRFTIPALYRFIPFGVKRRKAADIDDGNEAKYTSLYGSRVGIFNSDTLISAADVVICEGEIDAMLLHQSGIRAVSSTGGAGSWKADWAKFFTHVERVFVLYDNDGPGRDGAKKIQASIRRAQVLTLPEGVKDVGELFEKSAGAVDWLKWHTGG
jgi:DNA primase